jgi:hypothetical protein
MIRLYATIPDLALANLQASNVKHIVFSLAQALNDSALEIQARIRQVIRQGFTLRVVRASGAERSFILQQVKILTWANVRQGRLLAEVGIERKDRLLLAKWETGETRQPFVGAHVARPITGTAREGGSYGGVVKQELTFKALRFKKSRTRLAWDTSSHRRTYTRKDDQGTTFHTTGGKEQIKGRERTFILRSSRKAPMGGVFQRIGPGRDDIRMVYSFARAYKLRAMLHFVETAQKAFAPAFQEAFHKRFFLRAGRGRSTSGIPDGI